MTPNQRGGSSKVQEVCFLFGDIDFSDEKSNGKNYPPDQTTAMEILKDFPFKPALIQHSGNGLHIFWKFSETLKCTSRRSRERAQEIAKCFQRQLVGHFKKHGYDIASVGDLARLYRVPSSKNHKGKPAKTVEFLFFDPSVSVGVAKIEALAKDATGKEALKPTPKYPPADHELIAERCPWYVYHTGEGAALSDEPNWYAAASITACCKDGEAIFYDYSRKHPGYSRREAQNRFSRAKKAAKPLTCISIETDLGQDDFCSKCVFAGKFKSPVQLGHGYGPKDLGPVPLGYNSQGLFVLLDQTRQIIIQLSSTQLLSSQNLIGLAHRGFW